MAAGDNTYKESDGRAVTVLLTSTVAKGQVAYAETWLGVANDDGDSDDYISLSIAHEEYQFTVPTALDVSKGDKVYVDQADLTGHIPDSTAYTKTADGTKLLLFIATSDQDANDIVTGILVSGEKRVS